MTSAKFLFIVEGEKAEKRLYKKLTSSMGISANVFAVCANIHMLYNKLKKDDFQLNIDEFLLNLGGVSDSDKEMIERESPFTYIYLISDLDPQHYHAKSIEELLPKIEDVFEMLAHFNDETDPTIGKMYINYPMVESYRDCISFFDNEYKNRAIAFSNIGDYKKIVGQRGNSVDISKYTLDNFISLAKMNLFKANFIVNSNFNGMSYADYQETITQTNILDKQKLQLRLKKEIQVLHSGFFFMLDYWGNKNNFFDSSFPKLY